MDTGEWEQRLRQRPRKITVVSPQDENVWLRNLFAVAAIALVIAFVVGGKATFGVSSADAKVAAPAVAPKSRITVTPIYTLTVTPIEEPVAATDELVEEAAAPVEMPSLDVVKSAKTSKARTKKSRKERKAKSRRTPR